MKAKFFVDRPADGCIRVYPENQKTEVVHSEVKKSKVTLYDYGTENGFNIIPNKIGQPQPGTVFKIKDMPLVTLHESKNKFFIHMSFTKATMKDAQNIIKRDTKNWFDFLNERLQAQQQATPDNTPNN